MSSHCGKTILGAWRVGRSENFLFRLWIPLRYIVNALYTFIYTNFCHEQKAGHKTEKFSSNRKSNLKIRPVVTFIFGRIPGVNTPILYTTEVFNLQFKWIPRKGHNLSPNSTFFWISIFKASATGSNESQTGGDTSSIDLVQSGKSLPMIV